VSIVKSHFMGNPAEIRFLKDFIYAGSCGIQADAAPDWGLKP
jgi:hypothetical protein